MITNTFVDGHVLGLIEFQQHRPRALDLVVLEQCKLGIIDGEALLRLLKVDFQVFLKVYHALSTFAVYEVALIIPTTLITLSINDVIF